MTRRRRRRGLAERAGELPFQDGRPVVIGGRGWLLVLAGTALGFATLVAVKAQGLAASLALGTLFVLIQLGAFALAAGRHWTALFGRVGPRQVGQMVLFALVTMAVSLGAALAVGAVAPPNPNPVVARLAEMPWGGFVVAVLPTLPQLLGEELLSILPFLAMLWVGRQVLGLGSGPALLAALLGSSLLFGAAHLPTYGWNWEQAFGIIGSARLVLTLA
jgi:hypothetical protein